jgi:hypothetical protein
MEEQPAEPEAWTYTGTRPHEECPKRKPHKPHLWSPTRGRHVAEDETTPDLRACTGRHGPPYNPHGSMIG